MQWAILRRIRAERVHNPTAFGSRLPVTALDCTELLDLLDDGAPEVGAYLEVADELAAVFARAQLSARQRELFVRHVGGGELLTGLAAE